MLKSWYNSKVSKSAATFEDFTKLDLRVGKVLKAAPIEESDKLIRLTVSFGEEGERNILAGIKEFYSAEKLEGRRFIFVLNLEPKKMMGEESQGMLLAVDSPQGPKPLEAPEGTKEGEIVR